MQGEFKLYISAEYGGDYGADYNAAMRIVLALLYPVLASAQSDYVGAAACERCHLSESRREASTGHANALFRAAEHPLASAFRPRLPQHRAPDFEFRYAVDERGLAVRVADSRSAIVLPIEWAFGAGDQAVTFVSRMSTFAYLEHYLSYFTATRKMSVTPGQEALEAANVTEAAGFVHRDLEIVGCFQCHSTGPVDISGGTARPHETGVHCEACHGPGRAHAQDGKRSIRNPRTLSAVELNDLCGRCHRLPPAPGATYDWDNPWNVRFEPAYLSRSACFLKSGGKVSCLTCHAAHDPLKRNDAAYYNAKCVGCHDTVHQRANRAAKRDDCIQCHMPRVSPRPPLEFTNHRIGIYRAFNVAQGR